MVEIMRIEQNLTFRVCLLREKQKNMVKILNNYLKLSLDLLSGILLDGNLAEEVSLVFRSLLCRLVGLLPVADAGVRRPVVSLDRVLDVDSVSL